MSILLKCDKCGKTITEDRVHESNFNWCILHYVDNDGGMKEYHLCEKCKTEFNAWIIDIENLLGAEF